MQIDPRELKGSAAYSLFISTLVPRPIAWVSTLSPAGQPNLAPFSFFMGVTSDPPTLAVAIGRRRGQLKDTARNLETRGEFVVNVVTEATARGSSFGFLSNPEARIARTSDANISDQSPFASGFRQTYNGLIPSGSRASVSRRAFGSHIANANIPRSRRTASRAPQTPSARSMTTVSPVD